MRLFLIVIFVIYKTHQGGTTMHCRCQPCNQVIITTQPTALNELASPTWDDLSVQPAQLFFFPKRIKRSKLYVDATHP